MNSLAVDATNLVPGLSASESACFVAFVLLVVCPTGHAIRSLAGLQIAHRIERWALVGILGVLWTSIAYFALGIIGRLDWHPVIVWLPVVLWLCRRTGRTPRGAPSNAAPSPHGGQAAGIVAVALVGLFVAGYLGQVAGLVEYDHEGLKLHGAFFSDKLAGTATCAALMHDVPPRNLQFSGQTSFTHYFPRVFVAASCRVTGIDFVSGFWFHAAALGIAIEGLAILAFCKRLFGSYWFGCLALVLHGLFRYTAEQKPLDLSFAMLLVGLLAVDRCHASAGRRWGILAVCLFGAMPTYEVFHAATTAAGLLVWWAVGAIHMIPRRRSPHAERPPGNADGPSSPLKKSIRDNSGATAGLSSSVLRRFTLCTAGQASSGTLFQRAASQDRDTTAPAPAWQEARFRTLIAWPACLLAFAAVRMLAFGTEVTAPPEIIARNSYRDSYKHEWQDLLRESSPQHPVLATIYHWKRGKPFGSTDDRRSPPPDKPGPLKRLAGKVAYEVGFAGYFLIRFLNVAVFGCVALWLWFRRRTWPAVTICGAAASMGLVGIAVPFLVTLGHYADDRWWETPNIYRFTTLGCMLLVLLGCGVMADAARQWRRPLSWVAGSVVAARVAYLLIGMATPPAQFTLVDHDRLEALAFLRSEVPFGQIVLHPWTDDLIRDTRRPDQVSWVYQDHFMLGASLAGQQMYFEGKPDHSFSTGRVTPEDVFRRIRLREEFYQSGRASAVDELTGPAGVSWVVSDAEHTPPPRVADHWEPAFANATVTVFRKPTAHE